MFTLYLRLLWISNKHFVLNDESFIHNWLPSNTAYDGPKVCTFEIKLQEVVRKSYLKQAIIRLMAKRTAVCVDFLFDKTEPIKQQLPKYV